MVRIGEVLGSRVVRTAFEYGWAKLSPGREAIELQAGEDHRDARHSQRSETDLTIWARPRVLSSGIVELRRATSAREPLWFTFHVKRCSC
jgi:hypothetical protein